MATRLGNYRTPTPIGFVHGFSHNRRIWAFNPLNDVLWKHAWWESGPRWSALGVADAAAITTVPDEVGSADLTRSGVGPTRVASDPILGGRGAFRTGGTEVLASAVASISLSLPYSIFWVGRRMDSALDGNVIGGPTLASAIGVFTFFNIPIFVSGDGGAGIIASGNIAMGTGQRVLTAVVQSGTDSFRIGGATATGNSGSSAPTRIALGGAADKTGDERDVETVFLGLYEGDLLAHSRFADLEEWAAAGGAT